MRRVILLLIACLTAVAAHAEERVGLVVSGGISLGAYQGGVLFARIKALRASESVAEPSDGATPRAQRDTQALELITGASAGGINTWLAVVGWCDARDDRMALFANPFFDIWTNVGLDVLLPTTEGGRAYAELLAEPLGSARVVRLGQAAATAPDPPDPFAAGGHPQGLLTRNAFGVVGRYLVERLADTGYREGCRLRTAVTLTGSVAVGLPLAAGDAEVRTLRYVVPLAVDVRGGKLEIHNDDGILASGDATCLRPGVHPWEACHPSVGRALGLPEVGGQVPGLAVVRLVQGASAFPVAFSPVPMSVCATAPLGQPPPPAGGPCPGGLVPTEGRFIDGGFFDNVPLGPALELAHDEDLRRSRLGPVDPLAFLYVDPELRRGAPRLPEDRHRPDGLGGFTRLVNYVYREARAMELQGLERHCSAELAQEAPAQKPLADQGSTPLPRRLICGVDTRPPGARRFLPSARFHGITGRLAGSFGAFLHRAFRIYDYLVGVYDGVHATAARQDCQGAPVPARCRAERFRDAVEVVLADFDAPQPEAGVAPRLPRLEGPPARADDVRRFLYRLFVYEHRQLDPAAAAALCATLAPDLRTAACERGDEALAHSLVWALHRVFAQLDGQLRASVLTANLQIRLRNAELETNLDHVLEALEPYLDAEPGRQGELETDRHAWLASVLDRLARRAIAVERADQHALADLGPEVVDLNARLLGIDVVDGLQLARTAIAAGIERDDRWLDLDAGSTERVLGDHAWVPLVDLLVPHYLVGDPLYGGLLAGSTFHLRLRGLRDPGHPPNAAERLALALDAGIAVQDNHPVFAEHLYGRLGGGLTYDPAGRLVDDLELLYVHSRPLTDWDDRTHGLELAVRLATKVRVSVGTFDLRSPSLYFAVGIADWLALLAGLWQG